MPGTPAPSVDKQAHSQASRRNKENEPKQIYSSEGTDSDFSDNLDRDDDLPAKTRKTHRDRKRGRKKRKITRGDQLGDSVRERLTTRAYPYMRARIACEHAFPSDDLKASFTRKSFADSYAELTRLGVDLSESSSTIALEEADLVSACCALSNMSSTFYVYRSRTAFHRLVGICVKLYAISCRISSLSSMLAHISKKKPWPRTVHCMQSS